MKTAEQWDNELRGNWQIGNSSQFCDDPPELDSAECGETQAFIAQIQLDAYKAGMTAATFAIDKVSLSWNKESALVIRDLLAACICDARDSATTDSISK